MQQRHGALNVRLHGGRTRVGELTGICDLDPSPSSYHPRALKTCEAGRLSEVILYFNFGLLNHRDTLRAMERFARDVMPHFAEKTEPAATTPSTPSSAR